MDQHNRNFVMSFVTIKNSSHYVQDRTTKAGGPSAATIFQYQETVTPSVLWSDFTAASRLCTADP
jgi:hypothetical protein